MLQDLTVEDGRDYIRSLQERDTKYKRDDIEELLTLARDSRSQLIAHLESNSAEAFEKDFGVRSGRGTRFTIARLLQTELDGEKEHLEQIRKAFSQ